MAEELPAKAEPLGMPTATESAESIELHDDDLFFDEGEAPTDPVRSADLADAWFDAPPPSTQRAIPSSLPPGPEVLGDFVGDELADRWFRG